MSSVVDKCRNIFRHREERGDLYHPRLIEFLTEDQIVADLLSKMNDRDRQTWRSILLENVISGHHTTGQTIRNNYQLWDAANPYTHAEAEPNADGIIDHPLFPDQVSTRIMQRLWGEVNR
jgi:hypothetical protein